MTGQVRTAIAARLRGAGLAAVCAYEQETLRHYGTSVTVIGARETRIERAGLRDYLGTSDPRGGEDAREIYGRKLALTLSADVYTPEVLLDALPEALRVSRIVWGRSAWDTRSGMFLLPGSVECTALYTAEVRPDETVLHSFVLKGEVSE